MEDCSHRRNCEPRPAKGLTEDALPKMNTILIRVMCPRIKRVRAGDPCSGWMTAGILSGTSVLYFLLHVVLENIHADTVPVKLIANHCTPSVSKKMSQICLNLNVSSHYLVSFVFFLRTSNDQCCGNLCCNDQNVILYCTCTLTCSVCTYVSSLVN